MKPAKFDYFAASTVKEAVDALAAGPEAHILAGGQSLVPMMNLRLAQPKVLVDINRIKDLNFIEVSPNILRLGGLCRHRSVELSLEVRQRVPLLAKASALIGHVGIRNRGTLGGVVAHADPASEVPAALVALNAIINVTGPSSQRRIAATDFFTGYFSNSLDPTEMVTSIEISTDNRTSGQAFVEFTRRAGDYALVGVAAIVERSPTSACVAVRLVACGVADRPVDLSDAAISLIGESSVSDTIARQIGNEVSRRLQPGTDVHASATDRLELAQLLAIEGLRRALAQTVKEKTQ